MKIQKTKVKLDHTSGTAGAEVKDLSTKKAVVQTNTPIDRSQFILLPYICIADVNMICYMKVVFKFVGTPLKLNRFVTRDASSGYSAICLIQSN